MLRVMRRLEALENSQKASVQSALEELKHFIKMPMFNKEKALDYLINLKTVAKESNNPKSRFFNAVLQAMKDKIGLPDSQFQQYLQVLLGDKDHEKVLDSIAKVDKAMRVAVPRPIWSLSELLPLSADRESGKERSVFWWTAGASGIVRRD